MQSIKGAAIRLSTGWSAPRSSLGIVRDLHVTAPVGRKNLRKFSIPNRIMQYEASKIPKPLVQKEFAYAMSIDPLKIKHPGFWINEKAGKREYKKVFVPVKEMEPELMVPDLTDFKLKPYVSYRAEDIVQSKLTAKALFNQTYADEILKKVVHEEEVEVAADPEQAAIKAKQAGADMFLESNYMGIPKTPE